MITLSNVAGADPADGHRVTFVVDGRNCLFAYCGPNADLSVINGFGLVRREADHSVWRRENFPSLNRAEQ